MQPLHLPTLTYLASLHPVNFEMLRAPIVEVWVHAELLKKS